MDELKSRFRRFFAAAIMGLAVICVAVFAVFMGYSATRPDFFRPWFGEKTDKGALADPLKMVYEELAVGMDYDAALKIIEKHYSQKPYEAKETETPDGKGKGIVYVDCKTENNGKRPATILITFFLEKKMTTLGIFHFADALQCREQQP